MTVAAGDAPCIKVVLRPWEYALAAQVGAQRAAQNHDRADAPHYDRSRMEDDRTAQHAAAAAECATARALNKYWTAGGAWDTSQHNRWRKLADVGTNIEVRRVRDATSTTFAVDDRTSDRVLVACYVEPPEMQTVRVLGWITTADALRVGVSAPQYPTRKRVPISALSLAGITPP